MQYTAALVLAAAAAVNASSVTNENGNYFTSLTKMIKYTNLVTSGTYKEVSYMNSDGACDFKDRAYSGPIAPYNEELAMAARGPLKLKEFAAYIPAPSKKREEHKSHRRHNHQHLHQKHAEAKQEKARAVGDKVTAIIDGVETSWTNTYDGKAAGGAAAPVAAAAVSAASPPQVESKPTSAASSSSSSSVAPGDYKRVSYYNAESKIADNVVFLGNYGGSLTGSGTFDYKWGMSTSYLSADGTQGAATPNILADVLVPDNKEYTIWTAEKCVEGDSCGYWRPGSVAYHGWGGADKVFLFKFQMPLSGNREGANPDMSALWSLNAKVPRTGQYSKCSCWPMGDLGRGCGEADFFEILAPGDTKAKSAFHFLNAKGSSAYMARPVDKYIKMAVVFQESSSTASIKIIDDSADFATSLTPSQIKQFIDTNDVLSTIESFL